jgi:hypothetical protein
MTVLRWLRGLIGVGVSWGALWGIIGAGIGFALGVIDPALWEFSNPAVTWGLGMGAYGFVSGLGFGGLLSLREGSKTVAELSLPRVGVWGVLGSMAVPLLFGALGTFDAGTTLADVLGAMLVTGSLGGAFASGSVAIARRAEITASEERHLLA